MESWVIEAGSIGIPILILFFFVLNKIAEKKQKKKIDKQICMFQYRESLKGK